MDGSVAASRPQADSYACWSFLECEDSSGGKDKPPSSHELRLTRRGGGRSTMPMYVPEGQQMSHEPCALRFVERAPESGRRRAQRCDYVSPVAARRRMSGDLGANG